MRTVHILKYVLPSSLKRLLKRSIDHPEYCPVDARAVTDDPVAALYLYENRSVLVEVPLAHCRGLELMAFSCAPDSCHPFLMTARAWLEGRATGYGDSPLKAYYQAWQPTTAAELAGLPPAKASESLLQPVLSLVSPWEPYNPDEKRIARLGSITRENLNYLADLSAGEGWAELGPVSEAKGKLEFSRIVRLAASIRKSGYRRQNEPEGDITAQLLCHGSDWRVRIRGGQHRIAVLGALGHTPVPIRFDKTPAVIRREDAASWPQVRDGRYTLEQALEVFDRVYEARQPIGCNWPLAEWAPAVEGIRRRTPTVSAPVAEAVRRSPTP